MTIHFAGFTFARRFAVDKLFSLGDNFLGSARWQVVMFIYGAATVFRFVGLPFGRHVKPLTQMLELQLR